MSAATVNKSLYHVLHNLYTHDSWGYNTLFSCLSNNDIQESIVVFEHGHALPWSVV